MRPHVRAEENPLLPQQCWLNSRTGAIDVVDKSQDTWNQQVCRTIRFTKEDVSRRFVYIHLEMQYCLLIM